jgi:hypothetical protein
MSSVKAHIRQHPSPSPPTRVLTVAASPSAALQVLPAADPLTTTNASLLPAESPTGGEPVAAPATSVFPLTHGLDLLSNAGPLPAPAQIITTASPTVATELAEAPAVAPAPQEQPRETSTIPSGAPAPAIEVLRALAPALATLRGGYGSPSNPVQYGGYGVPALAPLPGTYGDLHLQYGLPTSSVQSYGAPAPAPLSKPSVYGVAPSTAYGTHTGSHISPASAPADAPTAPAPSQGGTYPRHAPTSVNTSSSAIAFGEPLVNATSQSTAEPPSAHTTFPPVVHSGAYGYGSTPRAWGGYGAPPLAAGYGHGSYGYGSDKCGPGCQPIIFKFTTHPRLPKSRVLAEQDFDYPTEVAVSLSYPVYQRLVEQASSFIQLQVFHR